MKRKNIKAWSLIVAFAAIITAPIFLIHWTGGDYSEAEKRNLAPKPIIFSEDGSINRNAMSETKSWLEDHIGFRDKFVKLSAGIKYYLFGQSPSDQVHIGEDGWLYYVPDNNLKIATGDYPLSDEDLNMICHNMGKIKDKMAAENREFVVVLPPSKISVYPENARCGDNCYRITPVDIVAERLEQIGVHVVRLKENLIAEKKDQQVYFKEDTHWNEAGAYIAYKTIIKDLNAWRIINTDPQNVKYIDSEHICDLTLMMGRSSAEKTISSVIKNQKAEKLSNGSPQYEQCASLVDGSTVYTYSNPTNANKLKALFWGDSMFGSWNATELLAENFNEFTYVWNYNISEELLQATDPDVVFLEMTERGIIGLATIQFDILQQSYQLTSVDNVFEAEIRNNNGNLSISTWGKTDPQVIFTPLKTALNINKIHITFSNINVSQRMQLYYAEDNKSFEEEKSIIFDIFPNQMEYELTGFDSNKISNLRLDFEDGISDICDIAKIELIYSE